MKPPMLFLSVLTSMIMLGSTALGQSANSGYAMYCNTASSTALKSVAETTVQNSVNLASNPTTGFSLVNGSSILNPTPGAYSEFSCLNNLFNQGLNVLFSPPNLSAILNALIQAACTEAESYITSALAPLNDSFFESANIDGFSPGFGVSTGLNNSGTVTTSVNGVSTGLSPTAVLGQIAGQTAGSDFAAPTFGGAY